MKQKEVFLNGNELAATAARQIGYHVMGYYPITPSTQIAENLDAWRAEGLTDMELAAAEGEHSAAGICFGAAAAGARVFAATSANGLLYALEQMPVQSGTRMPMVMNLACRTVSGPLCIKGDHSDVMYLLNAGWLLFFAPRPQAVYDLNLMALKLAEKTGLPAAVAYDGFFTSHQKHLCSIFEKDETVREYVGEWKKEHSLLDMDHPVTIGSYMGDQDVLQNKYELHLAFEEAKKEFPSLFESFEKLSGRKYACVENYRTSDADTILVLLGSSFDTAREAVDNLRGKGQKVGILTLLTLRPFPAQQLQELCRNAKTVIVGDRQDSYGAGGGNLSLEVRAALGDAGFSGKILARVYGLGGKDFSMEDAQELFELARMEESPRFGYYGIFAKKNFRSFSDPHMGKETCLHLTCTEYDSETECMKVRGGSVKDTTAIPKRLAPGHGACPGCGIPVNLNLLLRGIEGNVVFLIQTGCGMVVTMAYPKTSFRVPCIHNLFQNGAATLGGVIAACRQMQKRGELPKEEITFVMITGDGGMDIGLGSVLGAAVRNQNMIVFEYDNGGYMNTGYQLSYSTPYGAKSATSHVGRAAFGKAFFQRDTAAIMAAAQIPYVAAAAESDPADFIKKGAKAAAYAREYGMAYVKALSACPLNWNSPPAAQRESVRAAVDCCYFPLFEVEQGITRLNYDPEKRNRKIPVPQWLETMGRTRHLCTPEYAKQAEILQKEVDLRFARLKARAENPLL